MKYYYNILRVLMTTYFIRLIAILYSYNGPLRIKV